MLMKQTNVEAKSMAHADVVDPLQPAAENDWRLLVIWKGRSNALCIESAKIDDYENSRDFSCFTCYKVARKLQKMLYKRNYSSKLVALLYKTRSHIVRKNPKC